MPPPSLLSSQEGSGDRPGSREMGVQWGSAALAPGIIFSVGTSLVEPQTLSHSGHPLPPAIGSLVTLRTGVQSKRDPRTHPATSLLGLCSQVHGRAPGAIPERPGPALPFPARVASPWDAGAEDWGTPLHGRPQAPSSHQGSWVEAALPRVRGLQGWAWGSQSAGWCY